ncbi:Uncharacterised protein [Vibrio cholerae]|nr:Uncharacterised protein [Vibrio cholerae]
MSYKRHPRKRSKNQKENSYPRDCNFERIPRLISTN